MQDTPFTILERTGPAPGSVLLVLGGVHGNEPCGPRAIESLWPALRIDAGTLLCVPDVNRLALARNQRFVDANLNRVLGAPDPATHEGRLAPPLCTLLERADFLLDLHSYTAGGPPFVFAAYDPATLAFARALPAACTITGWAENYAHAFPHLSAPCIGTTEYARAHGAVAVTFECGQHADPAAVDNGTAAIRAALAHAGLVHGAAPAAGEGPHIRMRHVFVKEKPGRHARDWAHLAPIRQGEPFAVYEDGTMQLAPAGGFVILPAPAVREGTEWGYLGTP